MKQLALPEYTLEPERYELFAEGFLAPEVSRRTFFKVVGGGLVVACLLPTEEATAQRRPRGQRFPRELGAWLHVGADSGVTVYTGKAEMGQNIRTSLTQVVAEELRLPPERIRLVMADTQQTPFDLGTFGSMTTPMMAPQLRRVAAAARELLLDLAAEQGKTERAALTVNDGKVVGPRSKPSFTFGQLTKGKKLAKLIGDTEPKPPPKWTVAGTSVPKVDGREFVTGTHKYASDVTRPGMVFGKVLRPPSFKAQADVPPGRRRAQAARRESGARWQLRRCGCTDRVRRGARPGCPSCRVEDSAAAVRGRTVQVSERASIAGPRLRRPWTRRTRLGQGGNANGGQDVGGELHGGLYRPCAAGAAGRRGGVDRRQADRVDGDAAALRRSRRTGQRAWTCLLRRCA